MLYRCRACEYECERGWLPGELGKPSTRRTLSCVVIALALVVLGAGFLALLQFLLTAPGQPDPLPWWVGPLSFACAVASLLGFFWLLERAENLFIRRKPCSQCGAKRWSRGYARRNGFPGVKSPDTD